jgi:hypothetical protein
VTPRVIVRSIRIVVWPAAAALASCGADRPFCSVAIYEAARSEFRLAVGARGIIEAGHDLAARSNGDVSVCATAGHGERHHVAWSTADAHARTLRDELARRLGAAGYRNVDEQELEESADVIAGMLRGPKATRVEGQTRALKLVLVERCDSRPASDPESKRLAEQVRGCGFVPP